jgi:hypothetical protein
MYAGFFVSAILALTLVGCQSRTQPAPIYPSTDRIETKVAPTSECPESVNPNLKVLIDVLGETLARAKWRGGYDLEKNGKVLLKMGTRLVLIGKFSEKPHVSMSEYIRVFPTSVESWLCRSQHTDYLIIDLRDNLDLLEGSVNYLFVYPNSEHRRYPVELVQLSNLFGKFLLVQVPDSSPDNLQEARKMIVHEGAHLFGQDAVINNSPPSPEGDQSGRTYIEQLSGFSEFQESIKTEFCIARDIFERDDRESEFETSSSVNQKIEKLIELLDHAEQRGSKFEIAELESYWYFIEGIPQYLEENIDIEANPDALYEQYTRLCERPNNVDFSVYFLYLGASILHGMDLISRDRPIEKKFLYLELENALNFRERAKEFLNRQLKSRRF